MKGHRNGGCGVRGHDFGARGTKTGGGIEWRVGEASSYTCPDWGVNREIHVEGPIDGEYFIH